MDEGAILVADDEDVILRFVTRVLESTRRKVVGVRSGREVLEEARRARPALIILDVCMPDMDGVMVLESLRNDPRTRDVPIIMLTGLTGEREEEELKNLGADDYLSKPFDIELLKRRVDVLAGMDA